MSERLEDPLVPISWGELFDKISILEIKIERLPSESARKNVAAQLAHLRGSRKVLASSEELTQLESALKAVNLRLWEIEDEIRALEARKSFGEDFIRTARSVYINNDERGRIKRAIDALLGSGMAEEKAYTPYNRER